MVTEKYDSGKYKFFGAWVWNIQTFSRNLDNKHGPLIYPKKNSRVVYASLKPTADVKTVSGNAVSS